MTAEQPKKQRLLEFREGEENVRRWIDEFVFEATKGELGQWYRSRIFFSNAWLGKKHLKNTGGRKQDLENG